jgi:hypothetical protein
MLNGDHSELEERSMILTAAVKPHANTLEDKEQKRQGRSGCFSLIVDTGCSTTSTGYKEDFATFEFFLLPAGLVWGTWRQG